MLFRRPGRHPARSPRGCEEPLKEVNADVQVEQEEYDEIVQIKAMFLNHDYQ